MHFGLDFRTKKSLHQFNQESMQGNEMVCSNQMININDDIAIGAGQMLFDGFGIDFIWFGEFHLMKTKRTIRIDIESIGFNLAFGIINTLCFSPIDFWHNPIPFI